MAFAERGKLKTCSESHKALQDRHSFLGTKTRNGYQSIFGGKMENQEPWQNGLGLAREKREVKWRTNCVQIIEIAILKRNKGR